MSTWSLEEATRLLEEARSSSGFPNRIHHDLSVLYAQQGFFEAALAEIEAAMAADPANRAVWHHYLALQKNNPAQLAAPRWRAMHLAYGDTLAARSDRRYLRVPSAKALGDKLRVGYLCPDTHLATERFVWPVLEHFDDAAFEVFAYWCHAADVAPAVRAYPRARHRAIRGLDDDAIASAIVADSIDILVDVAGHGAANALPVMALRPAPVRMTWLDYLSTTGLEAMDYRITDAVADPRGAEDAHVERLIRLPVPQWCYRPPPEASRIAVAPSRSSEGIVFGSASVPLKLSDPLLDLWARLLRRVDGARLRVHGIPEGRARERIRARIGAAGVEPARLEIEGRLATGDFLAALSGIDVVLDSHPFSGATSTLDALWQGVPVVTLPGPLSHGRSTASLLAALGRNDWCAESPDRFVEVAAGLAEDRVRLQHERERLRGELAASVLCDGKGFARAMEGAFIDAWTDMTGRTEPALRERTATFWRGAQIEASHREAAPRRAARGLPGWVLVASDQWHDLDAVPLDVPVALLDAFDVLGALGVSEFANGDVLTAGAGHVSGVTLFGAGDRIYCDAYLSDGMGECVALSGGAMLVRAERLEGLELPVGPQGSEPAFRAGLVALSRRLHRGGARLGIAVSLAVSDRSALLDPVGEYAAQRALEVTLGLDRWGAQRPAAVALRAAIPRAAWPALLPVLERRLDSAVPPRT